MPGPVPLPAPLQPLADDPRHAGVCCDFDGTLSAIVADPASARPVPGAVDVLTRLAERLGTVAVLSGRPVAFLDPFFGPAITLAGVYGIERRIDGERVDEAAVAPWRPVVAEVVDRARRDLPAGVRVETKGWSLTLHHREAPEHADEVAAWAAAEALATGLDVRAARQSVELHPPVALDKGTVVDDLVRAGGLRAVCVIGDDVGDLPAFDALDRLTTPTPDAGDLAGAVTGVRVGVRSPEEAEELVARADFLVDGPAGVVAVLEALLAAVD